MTRQPVVNATVVLEGLLELVGFIASAIGTWEFVSRLPLLRNRFSRYRRFERSKIADIGGQVSLRVAISGAGKTTVISAMSAAISATEVCPPKDSAIRWDGLRAGRSAVLVWLRTRGTGGPVGIDLLGGRARWATMGQ